MAPYYEFVCEKFGWAADNALLQRMTAANAATLGELTAKIAESEENEGESEVREAYLAKAEHFVRIGAKDEAVAAFVPTFEKTVGSGQRLDVVFTQIRLGLFYADYELMKRNIDKAAE